MNVDEYMDRDFSLLQKRVNDARKAYEQQDPERTMSQSMEMFDAFGRRFALWKTFFSVKCTKHP